MENKKIVFGRNPVHEYLREASSGAGMELHVAAGAHGKIIDDIRDLARARGIRVIDEGKDFFNSLGPSAGHQGVVLYLRGGASREMSEDEVLEEAASSGGVIVLLDQITDPHNAGSIIRTAEALGAIAVVIPGARSAGITPTVVKSSAGATAYIPVITVSNAAAFLDRAKKAGMWVIGTSDHGTAKMSKLREMKPAVVVIGSEGSGMRRLTEEKCDMTVRIPLRGRVSSLNASVAAGIVLYEVLGIED